MTRWWKCDLQVATPGEHRFRGPDSDWSPHSDEGRPAAADRYMQAARDAGLDAIVLADHNSAGWVDTMADAGRRHGVVVFPGFEVTSASGADGAHLILLGDPTTPAADLQGLLSTACGYGADNPRFDPIRTHHPAPSPRTLPQILDALPDGYLAIAPHAFGENGIASKRTIHGSLRWKALHHDRLGAIDVGDLTDLLAADQPDKQTPDRAWKERFVRRELDDFPGLPSLAFVSTSDAYSLDELGRRFTWIRMESPTLEGPRQAFLDHDARVVCDWDPRFTGARSDPNTVSHAWVERITLTDLTTAEQPLSVTLDPRLTVLIGGRGAGKSTIVAGLRSLYGDVAALPSQARAEAQQFEAAVFPQADLTATHHLAHSGEAQTAAWSAAGGSTTEREVATDFRVRVISQKELFERAANAPGNPHAISQNLLVLVDDAVAGGSATADTPASFAADLDEARTTWVTAARLHEAERLAIAQRPQIAKRVEELHRQVAAFDDDANRARREHNDRLLAQASWLDTTMRSTDAVIAAVAADADQRLSQGQLVPPREGTDDLTALAQGLEALRDKLRSDVKAATAAATAALRDLDVRRRASDWQQRVDAAAADSEAYLQELTALGLEPAAYEGVRSQLQAQTTALADLDRRAGEVPQHGASAQAAWSAYAAVLDQRHERRKAVLDEIGARSRTLRFSLEPASDTTSWVTAVRSLLSLRSDGFLEEVPALARWLWSDREARDERLLLWRESCVSGQFDELARRASLRPAWAARLRGLDPLLRARLAAEVAEEAVTMEFRRDDWAAGGVERWEALTSGSPGQRSAAMLSFVLHHGTEPLVLDQPEDDLDTEWITQLVVQQLRASRWTRQVVVVSHNANIPVNADAERIIVMENAGTGVRVRTSDGPDGQPIEHSGAIENPHVRADIQQIMEGGVDAFVRRERRYNNELSTYRVAMQLQQQRGLRSAPGTP